MRVAVVINSSAGSLIGREEAEEEVARHLAAAGLDAILVPEHPEGLIARLDAAIAHGADAVVVGGGDGSIAAAAQRLMGSGTALGILPLGTMNLLAHDLGIPTDLERAADSLANGVIRSIDVAEVNGHVYLCSSVLGTPSRLGRHRERSRGRSSLRPQLLFLLAALRASWQHRPMGLRVTLDGGPPVLVRTRALSIANNRYAEGFGLFMTRQRLDRGELALYIARGFGIWWALRMLLGMWLGSWRNERMLNERTAREVVIESRRAALRVMNDGEARLIPPPLVYRIHPQALRVIVPRPPEHPPAETAPA